MATDDGRPGRKAPEDRDSVPSRGASITDPGADLQSGQLKGLPSLTILNELFEVSDDPIYVCVDHTIVSASRTFRERFGAYSSQASCYEIVYGSTEPCPWCLSGPDSIGRVVHRENVVPQDGRVYNLTLHGIEIDKNSGRLGLLRDVTDRHELAERVYRSEALLHEILQHTGEGIFTKNKDLIFTSANPAFCEIAGLPESRLVGSSHRQLFDEESARFAEDLDAKALAGEVVEAEAVHFVKGELSDSVVTKTPLRDRSGEIVGLCGIVRDVTGAKRTEKELRRTETMLANILDASPLAIGYAEGGKLVWTNQTMIEMFSHGEDDSGYIGRDLSDFYSSVHEYRRVAGILYESIKTGCPAETEALFQKADGTLFYGHIQMRALDPANPPAGTIAVMSDISDRKKAENELKESEERYRTLTQNSLTGIYIHQDGKFVYANDRMAHMLGYEPVDMLGRKFWDFVHPDDREIVKERGLARSRGIRVTPRYEFRAVCKDGSTKWLEVLATSIYHGGRIANMGNVADVTERKEVELRLRESEERYRLLTESSLTGIFIHQDGRYVYVSERYASMLGYTPDEMLGSVFWKYVHPADISLVRARGEARENGDNVPDHYEFRVVCKDGSIKWVELMAARLTFKGRPAVMGNVADVDERRRAEHALRQSEERYRTLVEESFDGILIFKENRIVFANQPLHEMLGYDKGELVGCDPDSVLHPDYRGLRLKPKKETSGVEAVPSRHEVSLIRKDGSSFEVEISALRADVDSEDVVQVWVRDITDRKRAAEEQLTIEKLQATGRLAGGIAHDFNNILSEILGNLTLADIYQDNLELVRERMSSAESAVRRARGLTQQLLVFSAGGAPIKKTISIGTLVESACNFSLRGAKGQCELSLPVDLWPVEADEGLLTLVLNNLMMNADEAMEHKGTIKVSGENCISPTKGDVVLREGRFVKLSVSDEGGGIRAEHLSKIFDPYFTTKTQGTGLGLAAVMSIVRQHDGFVDVESIPGMGTSFHIFLPASHSEGSLLSEEEPKLVSGTGRILVMDDEDGIRELAAEMLTLLGYDVALAEDGSRAIELYAEAAQAGAPFDVVIMDLTVPGGMGGREALERLLDIDPDVKAIVSSGYSNDPIMAEYRQHGFKGVVAKPYGVRELGAEIHKLLHE